MPHDQHHKFLYFLRSEITEIYIAHAIRSFALAMISVFIPIFLLQQGYALIDVGFYFIIENICLFLFTKNIVNFAAKKGVKRSIAISAPITILFFLGLYNITSIINIIGRIPTLIVISAASMIATMFYFMGFHIDFSKMHEAKNSAKQVGMLQVISVVISIAAPLLGAIIIESKGFNTVFIINAFLIIIGVIPLFFSAEIHEPVLFKTNSVFSKKEFKKNLPYIGEGIREYAAGIYWPILLFLLAINLKEMGGIFMFGNALLALFSGYLGKVSNEGNQHKILRFGTALHGLSLFVRTIFKTVATVVIAQSFGAITYGMVSIPYMAIHYNKSQKTGAAQVTYSREIHLGIGRTISIIALITLLALQVEIIPALITMIIVGGVATFLMNLIREE